MTTDELNKRNVLRSSEYSLPPTSLLEMRGFCKNTEGVEVPTRETPPITFRDLMESETWRQATQDCCLPLALGRNVAGNALVRDLVDAPHLLVAGRAFTVLYSEPLAYKGGGIFGVAEFFWEAEGAKAIVRLLDDEPFVWNSLAPTATQDYGLGFNRELGISGGWYDTVGNLYRYYVTEWTCESGKDLSAGTDASAPVPELIVGTNRYDSVWWNPDGIALRVVTNSLGVMTGLAAPKPGDPGKAGAAYDYEHATNAVGLTVGLTRPTGVFKGSFKAWFDYGTTHTFKTVAYEGILTPEREDPMDEVAGRGFFLWEDKSSYRNALNVAVSYGFSWSYDLKILMAD